MDARLRRPLCTLVLLGLTSAPFTLSMARGIYAETQQNVLLGPQPRVSTPQLSAQPRSEGQAPPERPAPRGYRVVDELELLTHNILGKGDDCRIRTYNFGLRIRNSDPAFDLVGLNEYNDNNNRVLEDFESDKLGCDGSYLKDALFGDHSGTPSDYPDNSRHRRFHYPVGDFARLNCSYVVVCKPSPELDGGVGLVTRSKYPIVAFREHEWMVDVNWINWRAHGFVFARVQVRASPALYVDVYVAHVYAESDGCDRACRRASMEQMRDKMKRYSGSTPWPIIVMGDFNIAGPPHIEPGAPTGWADIVDVFGAPRDVWLEPKPHAIDELQDGATFDCSNPLADCGSHRKRIDYIFIIEGFPFGRTLSAQPKYKVSRVREQDRGIYDEGLSDHNGVWANLQIIERTEEICTDEAAVMERARVPILAINRRIDGLKARYSKLLALGTADSPQGQGILSQIATLKAERSRLAAAFATARAAYEDCLGEDIVIESDYSVSPPLCLAELRELESVHTTSRRLGVSYKQLLDDPEAEGDAGLDLEAMLAAYREAAEVRAAALVEYEACIAEEIAQTDAATSSPAYEGDFGLDFAYADRSVSPGLR